MSHLMNTYGRQPIAFSHGDGVWLFDEAGNKYLDALAGIAVSTLGHNHPALVEAISHQASTLIHTSNLYRIPLQERLADRLADCSGMDEVFFANTGCEANEAAIKLARLYGHRKGVEKPAVVVMEQSFHGRTLATLSATGNRKVQVGFEPLVSGFVRVPFNDLDALEKVAANCPSVVAVLFEPIQGEGGIHIADAGYMRAVRAVCDRRDWLMMLDEVQCGVARTGKWFGFQHSDILPDVMTLAKGLGSGVPIGACLAAGRAAGTFQPGNHGSTFGGNPLACAAALATLDAIDGDGLMPRAESVGERIRAGFAAALDGIAGIRAIRGKGLMIGIELDRACGPLVERARDAGVLINVTAERVIRLLPPLIFTDADADELIGRLAPLIREFLGD